MTSQLSENNASCCIDKNRKNSIKSRFWSKFLKKPTCQVDRLLFESSESCNSRSNNPLSVWLPVDWGKENSFDLQVKTWLVLMMDEDSIV